jgi:hypothetical protein
MSSRSTFRSPLHLPWVSFPLRDITRAQLRMSAVAPTRRFVPSPGFRNLSTASSVLELAGLFHPAATSRVLSPFRGFSPCAALHFLLGSRFLLAVAASSLVSPHQLSPVRAPSTCDASRLRGLHPRLAAFLRSGYSPRPKPLPSSGSVLLQVLAHSTGAPLDATASALSNRRLHLSQRRSAPAVSCSTFASHASPCDESRSRSPSGSSPESHRHPVKTRFTFGDDRSSRPR